MDPYLAKPLIFLVQTLFGLYILAVLLRFLLQWVRADFYNPVSQLVVKVTNPVLRPLRRVIPGVAGLDMAALVLILLLKLMELLLIGLIATGTIFPLRALLFLGLAGLIQLFIYFYIFTIFVQVIISWVNPHSYSPVTNLIHTLNRPILRPFQRLLPPAGGFDFSTLVALLALQLLNMLLVPPLQHLAGLPGL